MHSSTIRLISEHKPSEKAVRSLTKHTEDPDSNPDQGSVWKSSSLMIGNTVE